VSQEKLNLEGYRQTSPNLQSPKRQTASLGAVHLPRAATPERSEHHRSSVLCLRIQR
jgi:hypothetical protein